MTEMQVDAAAAMSPSDRMAQINLLRKRILDGDKLDPAEIRRGMVLMAGDRKYRVSIAGTRKKKEDPVKAEAAAAMNNLFSDLLSGVKK